MEAPGADEAHMVSRREKVTETGFELGHLAPPLGEGRKGGKRGLQEPVFFGGLWSCTGGSLVSNPRVPECGALERCAKPASGVLSPGDRAVRIIAAHTQYGSYEFIQPPK